MKKAKKNKSATPGIIIIVSIIITIATANPVPFFAVILFVWIFGDKFGKKYRK